MPAKGGGYKKPWKPKKVTKPKTPVTTTPAVPAPWKPGPGQQAVMGALKGAGESIYQGMTQPPPYYMGAEPARISERGVSHMGSIPYALMEEGVWQQGANIFSEQALRRMGSNLSGQAIPMGVGWPTGQQKTDVAELMRYQDLLGRQQAQKWVDPRWVDPSATQQEARREMAFRHLAKRAMYLEGQKPTWTPPPSSDGGYAPRRTVYRRPSYAGGGRGSVSRRTGLINWRIGL